MAKETDSEQQRESFRDYLNEVSEKVANWEPWERGILGGIVGSTPYDTAESKEGSGCSVEGYHDSNHGEG